jgi:hypothetical protein
MQAPDSSLVSIIDRFVADFTAIIRRNTDELVWRELRQRGLVAAKRVRTRPVDEPPVPRGRQRKIDARSKDEFNLSPLRIEPTSKSKSKRSRAKAGTTLAATSEKRAAQLSLDFEDRQSAPR